MDFIKGAFKKLKGLKDQVESSVDKSEQGLVDINKALGMNDADAELITELAKSGGSMAGSIGDVAGKAGKTLGSGVAKIFRDPDAAKPVAQSMRNKDLSKSMTGLAGKSQQSRLDSLPEAVKTQVLEAMREKGIDPSKLSK
jgi:hypothetical protein